MPKYTIDTLEVRATPDSVMDAYTNVLRHGDFMGDYTRCLAYLPYSFLVPYMRQDARVPERTDIGPYTVVTPPKNAPRGMELQWIPEDQWLPTTAKDLRAAFAANRDWWRQKVQGGRGISVHRGKAFAVCDLLVAGCPEWRDLHRMDGGWYQEDAYNFVADLFGWPHVRGSRDGDE